MINAAEFHKIVDIEIAEVGLQRIENVRDRYPQGLRPLPVHMGIEPRRRHTEIRSHPADCWLLLGPFDELLRHRGKLFEIPAARVLQLCGESADSPDTTDRRRIERQQQCFRNLRKFAIGCSNQRLCMIPRFRALVPERQRHEHRRRVRPSGAEDEVLAGEGIG